MAVTFERRGSPGEGQEYLIGLAAGDTVVLSPAVTREGHFGWLVKPANGATVSVKVAMRTDPGENDWADHATLASITDNQGDTEDAIFSHLSFTAATAGAEIHVQTPGRFPLVVLAPAFTTLEALDYDNPTVAVGATLDLNLYDLINYSRNRWYLRYSVSGGGAVVTPSLHRDEETGYWSLRLVGVAVGEEDVTLTARTPDGETVDKVISVTVEAAAPDA